MDVKKILKQRNKFIKKRLNVKVHGVYSFLDYTEEVSS